MVVMMSEATGGSPEDELIEEIAGLRSAVERLADAINEMGEPPLPRAELRGLTYQFPMGDHEPPVLIPASGPRKTPYVDWPARPTLGEWLGVCVGWHLPEGFVPKRAENLLLRVFPDEQLGVAVDDVTRESVQRALEASNLTADERGEVSEVLQVAFDTALKQRLVPEHPLKA